MAKDGFILPLDGDNRVRDVVLERSGVGRYSSEGRPMIYAVLNTATGVVSEKYVSDVQSSIRVSIEHFGRSEHEKASEAMIVGTSLEPLARKVHAAFTRERGAAHISNPEEKNRLYDMQTACDNETYPAGRLELR